VKEAMYVLWKAPGCGSIATVVHDKVVADQPQDAPVLKGADLMRGDNILINVLLTAPK
jgi:hypothetical protein